MNEDDFMKVPCKHCPFRSDIKPYLHPNRAKEIAYAALRPYSSFACHKTTKYNEYLDDQECTADSKECAGFLTLRAQSGQEIPHGFTPLWELCYTDASEMVDAYEGQWNNKRTTKTI